MSGRVGRSGLTLLEMVLAIFLFAMLVPLFAGVWPAHKRAVSQSRGAMCANHICRQVLEEAISSGYTGVDNLEVAPLSDRTITLVVEREDNQGNVNSQSQDFVWQVVVEDDTENASVLSGEKLVTARIEWVEQSRSRHFSMSTLLVDVP